MTTVGGQGAARATSLPRPTQKVDEAVAKQQDLLAEFEKIADELNRVLANLEGSTLVKRLKAASRLQYKIAGRIDRPGRRRLRRVASASADAGPPKVLDELAEQEAKGSQDVSIIMDDMQAYFERRRFMQFKTVLDEMRKHDVIGNLRQLGDDLKKENGAVDRPVRVLVRHARPLGRGPGRSRRRAAPARAAKSNGSLPPSIVLEVLQILEGEVNLREETRVAEQARPALDAEEYEQQADKLSETQKGLARPRRQGRSTGSASCPTPRTSSPTRSACWARSPG